MMVRRDPLDGGAEVAEEVKMDVAQPRPVPELYSELEGRLRLLHEVALVDPEKPVQRLDDRNGGLPDAHDADLLRLDEADRRVLRFEKAGEDRSGHPARCSPAHHDDLSNAGRRHCAAL